MQELLSLPEVPELLLEICTRWAAKHPILGGRIASARLLVLGGAVESLGTLPDGLDTTLYRVKGTPAQDGTPCAYVVSVTCGYPSCQCPDYQRRKLRCKHIWATALLSRLATLIEDAIPAPEPKPARLARKQRPLPSEMSRHCAKLHAKNAALEQSLPVTEVTPIRRGEVVH